MEKFTTLTATVAPLPISNVDTDMIIPKQFLKGVTTSGLGRAVFFELRYDDQGRNNVDFILNRSPYDKAEILITGDNFGCGSSREHAPWALLDFGIRCIISTRFADIFYNNCCKNGILPITLPSHQVDILMAVACSSEPVLSIDLRGQTIKAPGDICPGDIWLSFDIEPFRQKQLLEGLDDVEITLKNLDRIWKFARQRKEVNPWI